MSFNILYKSTQRVTENQSAYRARPAYRSLLTSANQRYHPLQAHIQK